MRILLYVGTVAFGFLGVATALRALELVAHGSQAPVQGILTGAVFLLLALGCWFKAGSGSTEEN